MPTVITLGTYDLYHVGHAYLFQVCREIAGPEGDVVVAVNPDEFVVTYKGKPPIQTYDERATLVASNRNVTRVVQTPGPDVRRLLLDIDPAFIVIGKDWASRDYHAQLGITPQWCEDRGIHIVYLERIRDASSTELKARVVAASTTL